MPLDADRILLQRARQLDPASRNKGMRGLRLQLGVKRDGLGGLCNGLAVGHDKARFDGSLRPRAAFEQAALDQQNVSALADRGHNALDGGRP